MGSYYSTVKSTDSEKEIIKLRNTNTLLKELLKSEHTMRIESQHTVTMLEGTVDKYKSLYYELCKDAEQKDSLNWD